MKHWKNISRLLRPVQWIKNLFVFSGVLFGGQFMDLSSWMAVVVTAFAFCLVSSSIYVLNDIFDCESDKVHPTKKLRPIASGAITLKQGSYISVLVGALGLILGFFVSIKVFMILLTYLLLNIAYSKSLKHVVILDVFCISAGFMLRILAGTV